MDSIEPILPLHSSLPAIAAAQRSGLVHRDGHGGGGSPRDRRRRRQDDEDGVEVDVDGVDAGDGIDDLRLPPGAPVKALLPAHRIDLTAGGDEEPPAHQIDLSA